MTYRFPASMSEAERDTRMDYSARTGLPVETTAAEYAAEAKRLWAEVSAGDYSAENYAYACEAAARELAAYE